MYCADCESIDDYFFDKSTYFWLFAPTTESFGKLASFCGSQGLDAKQESSHCICVNVPSSGIESFLTALNGVLEPPELAETKVTTTPSATQPSLEDIGRIATTSVLIHRFKSKWLVASIEQERYETWFQPIVYAEDCLQSPRPFAHEGLFRVLDDQGHIVPPALAFSLAEQSDLLFSLDLVARRSAVQHAATAQLQGKLFINFNPSSIYDPAYCLRATAASIYELGLKPSDVVFEVTETHKASDLNHLKGILAFYRNAGFQVALDDIGSGWSGLNLLQKIRPDYVKIDMELVRDIHIDEFKQNIVANLIDIAKTNGIKVIAEGIEVEAEAKWLIQQQADYLQGYLFGKPALHQNKATEAQQELISASIQPLKEAAGVLSGG